MVKMREDDVSVEVISSVFVVPGDGSDGCCELCLARLNEMEGRVRAHYILCSCALGTDS